MGTYTCLLFSFVFHFIFIINMFSKKSFLFFLILFIYNTNKVESTLLGKRNWEYGLIKPSKDPLEPLNRNVVELSVEDLDLLYNGSMWVVEFYLHDNDICKQCEWHKNWFHKIVQYNETSYFIPARAAVEDLPAKFISDYYLRGDFFPFLRLFVNDGEYDKHHSFNGPRNLGYLLEWSSRNVGMWTDSLSMTDKAYELFHQGTAGWLFLFLDSAEEYEQNWETEWLQTCNRLKGRASCSHIIKENVPEVYDSYMKNNKLEKNQVKLLFLLDYHNYVFPGEYTNTTNWRIVQRFVEGEYLYADTDDTNFKKFRRANWRHWIKNDLPSREKANYGRNPNMFADFNRKLMEISFLIQENFNWMKDYIEERMEL